MAYNQRTNHKTMRITDEALEYIETFDGNTFNDRINNMIDYFINSQKRYESDLRFQESKIEEKKELLKSLVEKSKRISDFITDLHYEYKDLLR